VKSQPEQRLQRAVADYLAWALLPPAWFTAIAHGARLGDDSTAWLRGGILRGTGTKAGVPDILIVHEGRAYFVELKSARGSLSEAQRTTHSALTATGCPVAVCRSLDDVQSMLWAWRIPTRSTKPSTERIRAGFRAPQEFPASDLIGRRRRRVQ
jgi:hypothetical protein